MGNCEACESLDKKSDVDLLLINEEAKRLNHF